MFNRIPTSMRTQAAKRLGRNDYLISTNIAQEGINFKHKPPIIKISILEANSRRPFSYLKKRIILKSDHFFLNIIINVHFINREVHLFQNEIFSHHQPLIVKKAVLEQLCSFWIEMQLRQRL